MINWDKLDTTKTYVCLEYGTGKVSELISKLTKEFCYNLKTPSHVFALVYDDRMKAWTIWESHAQGNRMGMLPSGTRMYYKVILEKCLPHVVLHSDVYQVDINKDQLKADLNKPYGLGDISRLLRAITLHRNGKQKDFPGLICSEYIARAYVRIQDYLNLPPHCITPAHWLKYFLDNGVLKVE